MADEKSAPPLRFIEAAADGYCDPVTGACVWPGAATAGTSQPEPPSTPGESPGEAR